MDNISSPTHYKFGGIECIDYMQAKLSREEFCGYLRGCVFKYLSRAGLKKNVSELEDFQKARWYLDKLIAQKNPEKIDQVKIDEEEIKEIQKFNEKIKKQQRWDRVALV